MDVAVFLSLNHPATYGHSQQKNTTSPAPHLRGSEKWLDSGHFCEGASVQAKCKANTNCHPLNADWRTNHSPLEIARGRVGYQYYKTGLRMIALETVVLPCVLLSFTQRVTVGSGKHFLTIRDFLPEFFPVRLCPCPPVPWPHIPHTSTVLAQLPQRFVITFHEELNWEVFLSYL